MAVAAALKMEMCYFQLNFLFDDMNILLVCILYHIFAAYHS